MKKLYFILLVLLGATTVASAQYVDNALSFSLQNYGSTARVKAMGNAFGALGGDFGSLSINPAGLGIYQRGEFSTSVSVINQNNTETTYQGNLFSENNNKSNFKNFGYVSTIPMSGGNSGLISINFGLGFNRLSNLNLNSFAGAGNSPHSRMDAFAQNTNGINYNKLVTTDTNNPYQNGVPWESKMAWENYLIDVTNASTTGDKYSTFLGNNETVKQTVSSVNEGFINEYLASLGANFNHGLYMGATLGIQDLFYDNATLYSESGENNANTPSGNWGRFDYSSKARTSGVGYNLKLGAIYRPVPSLRLGVALHTPTFFFMKETYSSVMTSTLSGFNDNKINGSHREETPIGNYSYSFQTPLHAIGSIAYQFAKKGLVSFDYEYVDYSVMRYRNADDGYGFSAENNDIKAVYKAVGNIRIGAEYRLTDAFSLRGGMELFGNPYKSSSYNVSQPNADYKFKTYNGGIGYRSGKLSIDMTYSMGDKTNFMYLYNVDGVNNDPVKYHTLNHELLFTIALKM